MKLIMDWGKIGILFWFGLITTVNSLIAYDCMQASVNISTISLREVAACPDPETGYENVPAKIAVLQRKNYEVTQVYTCLLEVTRIIYRCSMFSHMSLVEGGLLEYIHPLGVEGCLSIHNHQEIRNFHGHVINKILPNSTTTASMTIAGSLAQDGNCEGVSYVEDGKTWSKVVVVASVKIHINDYLAVVKLDNDEISLHGGLTCSYSKAYCLDQTLGETVWDRQPSQQHCEDYSILYEGDASIVTAKNQSPYSNKYVVVEQTEKIFALSIIQQTRVCGVQVWLTEHPKIIVVLSERNEVYIPWAKYSNSHAINSDLTVYTNSKFVYVEVSYKTELMKLSVHTIHRRCLLHREILKNRLLLAPLSPDAVSTVIKQQLGFISKISGEVMYILQCTPKVATLRRTENCYMELPVMVNNKTQFMSPITHILTNKGEQIECSGVIPPLYFIEGNWMGLNPLPTQPLNKPIELSPEVDEVIKFTPIQSLGSGGIYTREEVKIAQEAMLFGLERKAVNNIVVRRMAGKTVDKQGFSTLNLFDQEEIEKLAHSTFSYIFTIFRVLGNWTASCIGVYVIFRIIKSVIEIGINAVSIHKKHGWSLKLCGAVWDTITLFILNRKQVEKTEDVNSHGMECVTENQDLEINQEGRIKEKTVVNQLDSSVEMKFSMLNEQLQDLKDQLKGGLGESTYKYHGHH